MDSITHTLFAMTLARTPLGRAGRGATTALVIASNAPDIDIIASIRGGVTYLAWHRGPTHGPLGIAGLGLLTAGIVWLGRRLLDANVAGPEESIEPGASPHSTPRPAENATFGMLVSISMIGVLLHILMDLPTSYGIRLLSPFDWHWFAFDWLPIIDFYLLMALVVGLVFSEVSKTSRRRIAAIVLVLMAANYGVRAVAHRQALKLAPQLFGPLLPAPCNAQATAASFIDSWPRAELGNASGKPCLVEIAAIPDFLSPFRWRVIARLSNAYELHEMDVMDWRFRRTTDGGQIFWRRAVRYPNQWTPPTFAAATTRTARVFLGFSRFPAARSFVDPTGVATVRWSDMRFATGVFAVDETGRRDIFSVVVRIGADGRILEERLGR